MHSTLLCRKRLQGVAEDPGLNQRALQELFREMESRRPDWTFAVFVSVVEIYQETLRYFTDQSQVM